MKHTTIVFDTPEIDITQASRAFWLSARNRWGIEGYSDLTPPWPRARLRWRVPESVNIDGERCIQSGPLSWTGQLWRFQPHVLKDVPWQKLGRDAEALATWLERSIERGASGLAAAQARDTVAALRRAPGVLDSLRTLAMLDATEFMVVVEMRSGDEVLPGQRARGFVSFFVGKEGRVLQSTKSVYVVPERPLSANDVYVVGSILELSVHPVLITLDALNNGHGSLEDGELVLKRSVAS